ncbi:MarR family transcriptional regulator [Paenibacillus jamilae]|uniref:MarR family transcriptional regulator n=1 Tax=Paenibacillus jamilae TaxID=114136 RepID=UPI003D2DB640
MNENVEQTLLITDVIDHASAIQKRLDAKGEDEEKKWMIANATESTVIEFLKIASVQMLHVLDAIGELEPVNGVTIAKHFSIPRGSVSKLTQRLVKFEVIRAESLSTNKKEVLFSLTPYGKQVYKLHQQLHNRLDSNLRSFLQRYNLNQIRFLSELLRDVSQISWVESETVEKEKENVSDQEISELFVNKDKSDLQQINEIVKLLQNLDAKKLDKIKDLIRIIFVD